MYLIKLVSKVEEGQVSIAAQKIAKSLNVDPAKVEKRLSKEQAIIGKAKTLEKAEDMASVFRNAGVKVAVIEDQKPAELVLDDDIDKQVYKVEQNSKQEKKVIGFGLGLGIFFMPYIFAWVTLQKGYSSTAKTKAFGYLFGLVVLAIVVPLLTAPPGEQQSQKKLPKSSPQTPLSWLKKSHQKKKL